MQYRQILLDIFRFKFTSTQLKQLKQGKGLLTALQFKHWFVWFFEAIVFRKVVNLFTVILKAAFLSKCLWVYFALMVNVNFYYNPSSTSTNLFYTCLYLLFHKIFFYFWQYLRTAYRVSDWNFVCVKSNNRANTILIISASYKTTPMQKLSFKWF